MITILVTGKVAANFRLTIPKEIREVLHLEVGDDLVFFQEPGKVGRVSFRKG